MGTLAARRAYPCGAFRRPQALFFAWELSLSLLCFLIIFTFPFDALGPRGGPYFLPLQKVGKDRRKGVSPPLRIPGPKWGAGRPPLETPKSRCAIRIGRTPRRLRGWSFGAVGESASACALATAAAPPPLRLGASPPCPHVPKRESPPIMRASAWYRVRYGFCGNAPANLPEAPAAQRLGVPSLPSRELRAKHAPARPQRGIPKGERLWTALLPTFLQEQKSRGPRAARARRRNKL